MTIMLEPTAERSWRKLTVEPLSALLLAIAFLLGTGTGLLMSHRYSAYKATGIALYRLDHLTGRITLCIPQAGITKCSDAQAD